MTTESRLIPIDSPDRNYNIDNHHNSSSSSNISTDANNFANNNRSTDSNDAEDSNGDRKPSYVGLSCAVSGYSSFIRYTSPSRKNSPPQQFRVSTEPQVLNYNSMKNPPPVRGQCGQQSIDTTDLSTYYPASHTRKIVTSGGMTSVETVTKFYNNNNLSNGIPNNGMMREASPGSDTSSVGSGGSLGSSNGASGGTTLVQKQIERLYGGKVSMVRLTSPEPKSDGDSSSYSPESESVFNLHHVKNNSNSPLELKTLKVPAVFRLLRPEFREQLKNNSCLPTDLSTVGQNLNSSLSTPTSSRLRVSSERIIPIAIENTKNGVNNGSINKSPTNGTSSLNDTSERIIPVVRDSQTFHGRKKSDLSPAQPAEKPALPVKPTSPTRTPRSPPTSMVTSTPSPPTPKDITSPGLVQKATKKDPVSPQKVSEVKKTPEPTPPAPLEVEPHLEESDPFPQPEDLEDDELIEDYPCAGVRERTLLCPIQEEDTESTASGSSVSVATKRSVIPNNNVINNNNTTNGSATSEDSQVIQEEVHDGHYFIKILENEIFKFEEQICDFEEDLTNEANDFPEEVREHLLAAIGKAKLLMSQKLAQFRGLCDKNINSNPVEDPFVPTSEDLAGFWDMVYIQIEHIYSLFDELTVIRKNGWKMPEAKKSVTSTKKDLSSKAGKPNKTKTSSKSNGGSNNTKPKSEAAKARDEARRKMLEEKKRQMKLKQQQKTEEANEVIFVEF